MDQRVGAEDERPVPRRRIASGDRLGLLAVCVLVVLAFFPVLFQGRTISSASNIEGVNGYAPFQGAPPDDHEFDFRPDRGASAWQLEPWAEVVHEAYSGGEVPLWNPYQGAGAPLGADPPAAVFDPLLLAVNLNPTPRTWDLSIVAWFVLGAIATYVYARVLGLREVPAVVASAVFALSGYFFLYSNNTFARSYIYLPILLLLVELVLRSKRFLPVAGLGVAVAGNILVGMPETSFFVVGTAAVYACVRVFGLRADGGSVRVLARLAGALVLGVLLASPALLLFRQYEQLSWNGHKGGDPNGLMAEPVRTLLAWIVPFYGGTGGLAGFKSWVGGGAVVLGIVGLCGHVETRRRQAWFFLAIAAVLTLKIYDLGVLDWVGRLPLFERIRYPDFGIAALTFALAMLAGIGAQVLWTRDVAVRRLALALALTASIGALLVVASPARGEIATLSTRYQVEHFGLAALSIALVAAAALLVRVRLAAVIATGVVVAELLLLAPHDMWARRADPFLRPDWYHLIAEQGDRASARVFGSEGRLYPDTASALRLQDIRALDALYVERYRRYVRAFLSPMVYDRYVGGPWGSVEAHTAYLGNRMFDALAVRYVVTEEPVLPDAAGGAGRSLRLLGRGTTSGTYVYENESSLPRAWLVHTAHAVRDEDAAFGFLRDHGVVDSTGRVQVETFDPRTEAVVEVGSGARPASIRELSGPADCPVVRPESVTVRKFRTTSMRLTVEAACRALLVLPDTYFPGWEATIDGRAARVYATNGAFRSVVVEPGTSQVEFRFRPKPWRAGVKLSGLTMLAILIGIAWSSGAGRRVRAALPIRARRATSASPS